MYSGQAEGGDKNAGSPAKLRGPRRQGSCGRGARARAGLLRALLFPGGVPLPSCAPAQRRGEQSHGQRQRVPRDRSLSRVCFGVWPGLENGLAFRNRPFYWLCWKCHVTLREAGCHSPFTCLCVKRRVNPCGCGEHMHVLAQCHVHSKHLIY